MATCAHGVEERAPGVETGGDHTISFRRPESPGWWRIALSTTSRTSLVLCPALKRELARFLGARWRHLALVDSNERILAAHHAVTSLSGSSTYVLR